ncbi:hypothetical protein PX699_30445 [Sphingobium sp. H39-3-25]|uniref:hypothetical protein n=1 Tax=Sphingobium arseniciresistens TaxID=3030834 RepID=UPI0023B997F7|nr:hypothetical protein [Sphingobium arseniciresistens]
MAAIISVVRIRDLCGCEGHTCNENQAIAAVRHVFAAISGRPGRREKQQIKIYPRITDNDDAHRFDNGHIAIWAAELGRMPRP